MTGFLVGTAIGLVSAYRRGFVDEVFGRFTDLMLAFPALIFALLLLAAFGSRISIVVIAIAIATVPGVTRIARAAAFEVVDLPYVEAARARGESVAYITAREMLPNITRPLLVDFGLRLTGSILLVAALSFLGLGIRPPAADWGLMIGENRMALTVQPWPIIVPIVAIAFITIGINLVLDGYRRRNGAGTTRSDDRRTQVDVSNNPESSSRTCASMASSPGWTSSPGAFAVRPGTALGLVGESGSGKTTVAMALMGFARPGTRIVSGHVRIGETDILALEEAELRRVRGRTVSYVPQNPSRALSPGMRVRDQLEEIVAAHVGSKADHEALNTAAWEAAQLPGGLEQMRRFPHQLSGGQQQRVAIAMALVCRPAVIVMDEPTTGLDVLTQQRLLDVIGDLRARRETSIVYISHDLGVVRNLVDDVIVMYGGRVVEQGAVDALFQDPQHPYTRRLLEAIPRVRTAVSDVRGIPGHAVEPWNRPAGCPFAPRCDYRIPHCDEMPPPIKTP